MAVDKRRARDGNRSAWEVVDGPGGVRAVFEAVVSSDGLDALQMASRRMTNARMNEEEVNRALKARYRLDAFIERLEEMGREEVQPFDMGWRAEPGSAGEGLLPTRSPGTKGAGGERAAAVVVRLLGELPACDGLSALAVVVDGVNLPEPVDLNGRDDPLLPTSVALVGPGSLFANRGLFAVQSRLDSGLRLGGLPELERDVHGPLLPLPLYNLLTTVAGRSKGGAGSTDLALRIFVEGLCAVMKRDWRRSERRPVMVSTTLREFLSWFYPTRRPRPNEYWPRLMDACAALDREEARVPWRDPETGKGGLRRVVSLGDIPRGAHALDDTIGLVVHLPPGSRSGPTIHRSQLRYWGWKSEPAYRAKLALAYQWYRPGVTRIPAAGGKGEWVQSQDPSCYEPYSRERIVELCYPTSVHSNRRMLVARSWEIIRRLEAAGEVRIVGERILPPPEDLEIVV